MLILFCFVSAYLLIVGSLLFFVFRRERALNELHKKHMEIIDEGERK
jgi:hypothetical protein